MTWHHPTAQDEFNLKEYVEITEQAREYLALREQLVARRARARTGR